MIQVESLSVFYGERVAVQNATLIAPSGTITAIVGPSGCGKSSFLAALNRMTDLIPGARTEGTVRIHGQNTYGDDISPALLRRSIGMIFQKANPFPLSIRQNLQLALREHGVRQRPELESRTEAALRDVGLWDEVKDRLDQPALRLSGGQQQRLCIARAIILEPRVLLMDEPCSALDPIASAHVESLIQSFKGRYTILIVTHNLAQARRLADHLAVFWYEGEAGRIIEQGNATELFDNPQHPTVAAYLAGQRG